MAPHGAAAAIPAGAHPVPPIRLNPLQVQPSAIPVGVSIPVGDSPESVCMNLEDELTKMMDEDTSRKVNPTRRARSVSRTPPNPSVKVRAVTLSSNPTQGIMHQCAQAVASDPFKESRRARHNEVCAQSRVRTKSKSGRISSRPPKSRLVMTGNALPDQEKTLEFMLEQKQQILAEQARNQALVDENSRALQQTHSLAVEAQQEIAKREHAAEVLLENQRQAFEQQVVQVSQNYQFERAATQQDVNSLITLFDQQKKEIIATAENAHASRLSEYRKLFDNQLTEKVQEIRIASSKEIERYKAEEFKKQQEDQAKFAQMKKEHSQQAATLVSQTAVIADLENRLNHLNQFAVNTDQEKSKLAIKLDQEETANIAHLNEFEDERRRTKSELQILKLENDQLAEQMGVLNEELRKARIANPKNRSRSEGARRPSVQIGGAETFEISTPREPSGESTSPGGDGESQSPETESPGGDSNVASTETDEDEWEEDYDYQESGYEDDESWVECEETWTEQSWTEEEWQAWNSWWSTPDNSDVPSLVVDAITKHKERKSECLTASLSFQSWPSFGESKGWRFNTKEKWAKGTTDSAGMLKLLASVEIAETWEEIQDSEKFAKINRLAYDALWDILPTRLKSELTTLKGKLMNPTEAGAVPRFLSALQIYWFVMRESKRPGALIGEQGFRDLLTIKYIKCSHLTDFQRQWDDCLANFGDKPTPEEFRKFQVADIYRDEVCKDSAFKNHLTIYRTSIEASLITPNYDNLHKIVDEYLAFQEKERRRITAEKAIEKKTAEANAPPNSRYALVALATDSKKPKKGDCYHWFYTGDCELKNRGCCPWNHDNKLPKSELRKGKGKGKGGKGRKGKGKGKDGKGGKGEGKGGKGAKGNGKGQGKYQRQPSQDGRSRSVNRDANGQPTRGKSPSGDFNARKCKWYKSGTCQAGDKCKFWHPGICNLFKAGNCQLGDKCVFRHPGGTALLAQGSPKAKAKAKVKAKAKSDADAAQAKAEAAQKKAAKAQQTAAQLKKEAEAAKNPQGDH